MKCRSICTVTTQYPRCYPFTEPAQLLHRNHAVQLLLHSTSAVPSQYHSVFWIIRSSLCIFCYTRSKCPTTNQSESTTAAGGCYVLLKGQNVLLFPKDSKCLINECCGQKFYFQVEIAIFTAIWQFITVEGCLPLEQQLHTFQQMLWCLGVLWVVMLTSDFGAI